jgi:DNA-binding NarL/FixJ family response regulator
MAAPIEKVTASAMINHTAAVARLRLGSMIQSSGLRSAGATGLAMNSHDLVTEVTSQRWYTSRMIALEGNRHENLMTDGKRNLLPVIRIVIAEDQAHVRRGAAHLLSLEQDMEVVGQACNGAEAVELARVVQPDVILMDLHMPVKGGVAATREIIQMLPTTQILVLTTLHDDETVFEAVRAGAHAYLLKDAAEDELLETIRALKRGESRLTPQIARKVMDQFARLAAVSTLGPNREEPAAPPSPRHGAVTAGEDGTELLNDKEQRVLQLISEGLSNRQIAETMYLAEGTIKNYVSRIMEKLHANTRIALALISKGRARQK